jgi:hypothetical protein
VWLESCRNAANSGAGGRRQDRGEGAATLRDEGAGMEREGTGIEREGAGMEREGAGMEREDGAGMEREGAGIEREGEEMRRGEGEAGILSVSRALAAKAWRREIPREKGLFYFFLPELKRISCEGEKVVFIFQFMFMVLTTFQKRWFYLFCQMKT